MTSLNRVHLIGQLGFDPEIKEITTKAGRVTYVARMSVVTNEAYKNADGNEVTDSQWHTCVAWGGIAELCKGLRKGRTVDIEGRIVDRSYKNSAGETKYLTEIIISKLTATL